MYTVHAIAFCYINCKMYVPLVFLCGSRTNCKTLPLKVIII